MSKKKSSSRRALRPQGYLHDPFALTSRGIVLVNAMWFDDVQTAEDALRRALREPSRVFVGLTLENNEVDYVVDYMSDLFEEPMGLVIGRRQRRAGGVLPPLSQRGGHRS